MVLPFLVFEILSKVGFLVMTGLICIFMALQLILESWFNVNCIYCHENICIDTNLIILPSLVFEILAKVHFSMVLICIFL